MKFLSSVLALFAINFGSAEALAIKQYRCNGYIQYRPCNQNAARGYRGGTYSILSNAQRKAARSSRDAHAKLKETEGVAYGVIKKQTYKRITNITGQWRGIVEGNGTLRLTLQILRNGDVESSRFMGEVALKNKSTSFNFVSAPPKGSDWTWHILVFAS